MIGRARRDRAATRALGLYSDAPLGDRVHTRVRWATAPLAAVEQRVPRTGRVLDVGCGHGLLSIYMALSSAGRQVLGVDVDVSKIETAKRVSEALREEIDVSFECIQPGELPHGPFDAIVIADVLYLLRPDARAALVEGCISRLAPGGVLLIKEIDVEPRWKARLAVIQERMATGVLGITEGDAVDFGDPARLAEQLRARGLSVARSRLDKGYLHPHHLIEASSREPALEAPGDEVAGGRDEAFGAQPEDGYFDLMGSVAETHWWYRGRRALVTEALSGSVERGCVGIDVGCGTAENVAVLEACGVAVAVGTDLSEHALGLATTRRPRPRVLRSVAEDLPLRDRTAGVLLSMDVIEHLDDDVRALKEYVRVMEPGAPVVLTVPAYEWLWSEHDDRACHRRRYTRRRLEQAASAAGIAIERTTYFYSFLVPPAVLLRRTPLARLVKAVDEEVSSSSRLVETVLTLLATSERRMARHLPIPFGLSILLVGRAPDVGAGVTER